MDSLNFKTIHISDPLEPIILSLFNEIGECATCLNELEGRIISRESFNSTNLQKKILNHLPKVKGILTSSSLTSLQSTAPKKQKNVELNFFRQLLRTRGYHLKPFVVSDGYNKTNGKKIIKRFYRIEVKGNNLMQTES
jgi:hypothetical protein